MTQPTTSLALLLTLAAGCTASKVDIGDGTAPPPGVLGASLTDYAGTWDGYAEAFTWNDGSDRIRITLDANGAGTIRLGNAPDLAPPDPDRAYPASRGNLHPMDVLPLLIAGYGYPVLDAQVDSRRIRFNTTPHVMFEQWCSMQAVYPWFSEFACVPGLSIGQADRNSAPVCRGNVSDDPLDPRNQVVLDCGHASTCMGSCSCDATHCFARDQGSARIDAALGDGGESLEGTLVIDRFSVVERITVRMTRM